MSTQLRIVIGGAIAAIVCVIVVHLGHKSVRMLHAGSEMAFIMDVVSFSEANQMRMPRDWEEFESWCATRPNNSHWKAENLKHFYSLPWGRPLVALNLTNEVLITVRDPQRSPISQENANNYMRCFISAALLSTNGISRKEGTLGSGPVFR